MRIFKSFATVAICAMVCAGFTACDDDDDDNNNGGGNGQPNPSKVFPLGTPSKIGSANVTTGANGLVSQIKDENTTVKFEYLTSRADNNYDVKMVITDVDYPTENDTFMMRLNNQGFVEYCLQTSVSGSEKGTDEWWFKYNSAGQMNYMKHTEGDNEVTTITYDNAGDITNVSVKDDDNNTSSCTISYSPLEDNKCGVMLFDECLGIDMDEMSYAYFAGLLGKATTHLPKLNKEDDGSSTKFDWTLTNGKPVKLISTYTYDGYDSVDEMTFAW